MYPEQLLLFTLALGLGHFVIKLMLILSRRQSEFFIKKLGNSYFFYNEKKIRNTLEVRVKRYYVVSNRLNKLFYTLMSLSVFIYIGARLLSTIGTLQPFFNRLAMSS